MRNNSTRLFVFLLGMALLWSCCGAANAVTPMASVSSYSGFALDSSGQLMAWGDDGAGQLGQGRVLQSVVPIRVGGGLSGVTNIASGGGFSVATKVDGTLWAWGANEGGQLGDGTMVERSTPEQIGGYYKTVATGHDFTVAVKSDGTLWAWGNNAYGQLGDGGTTSHSSPVQIGSGYSAVAAGYDHAVALKSDGTVWSWGANKRGQLGNGSTTATYTPKLVGSGFSAITAGWYHTLAIKTDGTLWAWGANDSGQLGDGTSIGMRLSPIQVGTGFTAIAGGEGFTIALKADGSLWSWGQNNAGQLGDGTTFDSYSPVNIGSGYRKITAGRFHAAALMVDGTLWAWGWNAQGQVGDGTRNQRNSPVSVGSGFVAIAAGDFHTSGVKTDGTVWTSGWNITGQLGDGLPTLHTNPVSVGNGFSAVAAGGVHTVALKTDGSLWAWGWNQTGALGDGTTIPSGSPIRVGSGYIAITAGDWHTAALKSDGTLWAWGSNTTGQLGASTAETCYALPCSTKPLYVGSSFASVSAGQSFTVAIKTDGTLWAWGTNDFGQLGNGSTNSRSSPVQIGSNFKSVSAGYRHVIGVKTDGTLWAWGANDSGQLGDGSTNNRLSPIQIGSGYSSVAAGYNHSLAVKNDSTLWAWGGNADGQLGDGTNTTRKTPALVGTGFISVATTRIDMRGYKNRNEKVGSLTVAVKTDGSILSWGTNFLGQLGDGTFAQRISPVLVVNPSADGFLNLLTGTTVDAPPELQVPFFVSSFGGITNSSATVSTTIKFALSDVGKPNSVYITAMIPAKYFGTPKSTLAIPKTMATTDPDSCVPAYLTSTGDWQQHTSSGLPAYVSNITGEDARVNNILNGSTTNLEGSNICEGYNSNGTNMKMRVIATIPGASYCPSTCPGAVSNTQLPNHSDSWWNSKESGWGITITDHDANAFVQWYTYDQSGHNQKYVISGGTFSNDKCQFSGNITHVTGPSWTLPTFDPNLVIRTTAGSGSFDFCSPDLAAGTIVFNYTVDGITGSKQLTRLPFGNDVPHRGGNANTGASDFTDLWWNPAESGWGVSVTQHGDNLFFRIFAYDTDNRPLLFVVPGVTFNGATSFTGNLVLTSGPWFGTVPFDPNQVVRTPAGTATLTFTDANNGVLSYTVNGVTVTKTITRMVF